MNNKNRTNFHISESLEITKQYKAQSLLGLILIVLFITQLAGPSLGLLIKDILGVNIPTKMEVVTELYLFIGIILVTLIVNKFSNKRPITSLGFHKKSWFLKYIRGVVFGSMMIAVIVGVAKIFGIISIGINSDVNWTLIGLMLSGFMIQGMAEEVITRGYLQNTLATRVDFKLALVGQAICFAVLHIANEGVNLMGIGNLFLVGLMFGLLFWYTDSIWFVGGLHSAWNFILGPVLGIEVSGKVLPTSIFTSKVYGSDFFTGGTFGMEASIFTSIFMILSIVIVYRLITKKIIKLNNDN